MLEGIARPLAGLLNWIARIVSAFFRVLGRPGKLLQDFMNGSWLGHSLHPVLVDVVVGGATAAVLLDLLRVFGGVEDLEVATVWVLGLAYLAGVASILTGWTDFKDTSPGDARNVAGLHGFTNMIGMGGFAFSIGQRFEGNHDGAVVSLLIGYAIISLGAYIGGHIVFRHGYMVNFNAFQRGKRAGEFTAVLPAADLPENAPTKATLGATAVVLVRRGDVVHALKDTCSHAGGPLSEGELRGDTIVCPWHGSAFRLRDGAVRHGPTATRQVRYEARMADGQVELKGPIA